MVKQNKFIWQIAALSILKKLVWVILIYTTSALAQKENKHIRSGNDYYEEENYKEAEVDYMKALETKPESYRGQFNLGGALYKRENYEDATKLYGSISERDVDAKERANSFYNLGNSFLKAEKYAESVESYKNALRLNPDDMDAKYNMEYAKKMMQQQEQKQDQNQDQDQEKKEDEEQEQEKNEQDQQQQEQEQKEQEQNQQQDQQNQQQQQQPQPQQISKQDAERMLEALKNDENKTLEKVKLQKVPGQVRKVEKDW